MKESLKEKLRSYEFWMSAASAIALVAGQLGADVPYVSEICSAVIALLVVIGIVKKPPSGKNAESASDEE